jgi:hypothetical protein
MMKGAEQAIGPSARRRSAVSFMVLILHVAWITGLFSESGWRRGPGRQPTLSLSGLPTLGPARLKKGVDLQWI